MKQFVCSWFLVLVPQRGLDGLKRSPDDCIKLPTKLLDGLLRPALKKGFHACDVASDVAMLNTGPVENFGGDQLQDESKHEKTQGRQKL